MTPRGSAGVREASQRFTSGHRPAIPSGRLAGCLRIVGRPRKIHVATGLREWEQNAAKLPPAASVRRRSGTLVPRNQFSVSVWEEVILLTRVRGHNQPLRIACSKVDLGLYVRVKAAYHKVGGVERYLRESKYHSSSGFIELLVWHRRCAKSNSASSINEAALSSSCLSKATISASVRGRECFDFAIDGLSSKHVARRAIPLGA